MSNPTAIGLGLAATVFAVAAVAAVAGPEDFPRAVSGKPDFSGSYDIATLTPYTRDPKHGENPYLEGNYAMFNTLRGARHLERVWIETHGATAQGE